MYLIGSFTFGIAKIFSLWLYAKEQQIINNKISAQSLLANIIFSLILIYPFQAAGLAFQAHLVDLFCFF